MSPLPALADLFVTAGLPLARSLPLSPALSGPPIGVPALGSSFLSLLALAPSELVRSSLARS